MGMGEQCCGGGHYPVNISGQLADVAVTELLRRAENEALQQLTASDPIEAQPTFTEEDRILVSVDRLERHQLPDGSFSEEFLQGNRQNLATEVQERGMPYAVSRTFHEVAYEDTSEGCRRTFLWRLGKTAVQSAVAVAESGYKFHESNAAHQRVAIEVEEALHGAATLRPGYAQVFLSPRMTETDAPLEVAKKEHLADDDAVRVVFPEVNTKGAVVGRRMESLLVPDIPLSSWVSLLRSPLNPFGKSIEVADNGSALPVMQAFPHLEVAEGALPEGPITLIEAVLPHITDTQVRQKVQAHLENFRMCDQQTLEEQAMHIAERQQQFDIEILKSRKANRATPEIEQFVFSLQNEWGEDALALIRAHDLQDGGLRMTRELEALLVGSKQNILMTRAGVLSGNTKILEQMSVEAQKEVYEAEAQTQAMQRQGLATDFIAAQEAASNRLIARQNIRGGAGCSGETTSGFGGKRKDDGLTLSSSKRRLDDLGNELDDTGDDEEQLVWSKGVCRIEACNTRPGVTEVGQCSVCRHCQSLYDKGVDPTKFVSSRKTKEQPAGLTALFIATKEEFDLAT